MSFSVEDENVRRGPAPNRPRTAWGSPRPPESDLRTLSGPCHRDGGVRPPRLALQRAAPHRRSIGGRSGEGRPGQGDPLAAAGADGAVRTWGSLPLRCFRPHPAGRSWVRRWLRTTLVARVTAEAGYPPRWAAATATWATASGAMVHPVLSDRLGERATARSCTEPARSWRPAQLTRIRPLRSERRYR